VKIATAIIKFKIPWIEKVTQGMFNHAIIFSNKNKITQLITKINNQKVIIINGRPKSFRTGFIAKLSNHKTTHHTKYNFKSQVAITQIFNSFW